MTSEVAISREQALAKMQNLDSIPSIGAILQPLIGYLQQPVETLDMQRVIDLISHDNSLAAQCLRMANSPLFGRWQSITTTRGAVVALGLQRMRDITISCCVLQMLPGNLQDINPVVFWEHSLACALVARRVAKRIGMKDPEQAYLAGLLHDLGIVVNLRIIPEEFLRALAHGRKTGKSLEIAEEEILGITHCETGLLLAQRWDLSPWLKDVISHHHRLSQLSDNLPLVALVSVSDRICRIGNLGYGHHEEIDLDWQKDDAVQVLRDAHPVARTLNWQKTAQELETYLKDVQKLVSALYRLAT